MKPMKVLLKTYFGHSEVFYKTIARDGTQRIWSDDIYLNRLPALPLINSQIIENNRLVDVRVIDPDFISSRIKKQMDKNGISYLMIVKPRKRDRLVIEEYAFTFIGIEAVQWTYEY